MQSATATPQEVTNERLLAIVDHSSNLQQYRIEICHTTAGLKAEEAVDAQPPHHMHTWWLVDATFEAARSATARKATAMVYRRTRVVQLHRGADFGPVFSCTVRDDDFGKRPARRLH